MMIIGGLGGLMRKIILNLAMSVDGYIADEKGGFDWILGQGDKSADSKEQFDFQKSNYQLVKNYSPHSGLSNLLTVFRKFDPPSNSYEKNRPTFF